MKISVPTGGHFDRKTRRYSIRPGSLRHRQVMGLQDGADNGKADSCSQTPAALMLTALISFPDNFSILFGNGRSGIGYGNSAAVSCDSDAFAICGVINGII